MTFLQAAGAQNTSEKLGHVHLTENRFRRGEEIKENRRTKIDF